jgi:hypothetical protein
MRTYPRCNPKQPCLATCFACYARTTWQNALRDVTGLGPRRLQSPSWLQCSNKQHLGPLAQTSTAISSHWAASYALPTSKSSTPAHLLTARQLRQRQVRKPRDRMWTSSAGRPMAAWPTTGLSCCQWEPSSTLAIIGNLAGAASDSLFTKAGFMTRMFQAPGV